MGEEILKKVAEYLVATNMMTMYGAIEESASPNPRNGELLRETVRASLSHAACSTVSVSGGTGPASCQR